MVAASLLGGTSPPALWGGEGTTSERVHGFLPRAATRVPPPHPLLLDLPDTPLVSQVSCPSQCLKG